MSAPFSRRMGSASTDWAWGGIGISMATASASFAAYMIATAPAQVTGFGSKDFNIFVHWDRRNPDAVAGHAAPAGSPALRAPAAAAAASPAAPGSPPPSLAAGQAIDPSPTGSIPDGGPDTSRHARSTGSLADFRLRDVFGDHALIEHASKFSLVKQGSILAGAGEVLSIERQGRGWIVKTSSGVIGGL